MNDKNEVLAAESGALEERKKAEMQKIESRSLGGLVVEYVKQVGGLIKELVVGGDESDLLRDLGVKRGVKAAIRYALLFAIFPILIARYLINPTYSFVEILEKMMIPFLRLDFALGENPALNVYSSFLSTLSTNPDAGLAPSLEEREKFITMYILSRVALIAIFFFLVVFGAEIAMEIIGSVFENVGFMTILGGLGMASSSPDLFGESAGIGAVGAVIYLLGGAIGTAFLLYIFYFFVKYIIVQVKHIAALDQKDLHRFLDIALAESRPKAAELYGEDVEGKAYFALVENFIEVEDRFNDDDDDDNFDEIDWDDDE